MKKAVMILLFLSVLISMPISASFSYAAIQPVSYVYIKSQNAILYNKVNETFTPVCTLPETYFCAVLEDGDDYIKVSYYDLNGYIKASDIERVDYEPKYKYALENKLTLLNDGFNINMRLNPDHTLQNIVAKIPESKIYYYGSIKGTSQISVIGDTWYYARAEYNGSTVYGYIYSLYGEASPIPDNIIEAVAPPMENNEDHTSQEKDDPFEAGGTLSIIIIISLCIPVIIAVIIFYGKSSDNKKSRYT